MSNEVENKEKVMTPNSFINTLINHFIRSAAWTVLFYGLTIVLACAVSIATASEQFVITPSLVMHYMANDGGGTLLAITYISVLAWQILLNSSKGK
jgi:hypothetical protein